MNRETVVRELAEELRTNGGLRRRLGMVEGDATGVVEPEGDASGGIYLQTADGETFAIGVGQL